MIIMLTSEALEQAAHCLKVLAHPHRLKIIELLLEKNLSVGEIANECEIASHVTSEHLRLMQHCGFLESRREGRAVYYSVSEPHLEKIINCMRERFGSKRRK